VLSSVSGCKSTAFYNTIQTLAEVFCVKKHNPLTGIGLYVVRYTLYVVRCGLYVVGCGVRVWVGGMGLLLIVYNRYARTCSQRSYCLVGNPDIFFISP
jgi:hypothetical protein